MTMVIILWLILMSLGPVVGDLVSFLDETQANLDLLHDAALQLYQQRCNLKCAQAFESNSYACSTTISGNGSACSTQHGAAYYTSEPGCMQCSNRKINNYFSTLQTPTSKATCTDRLNSDICWTKHLDNSFQTSSLAGRKWQLIATGDGLLRLHPGIPQEECYSYDPRLRSWYVAATTGPKDVVILLDTSSSMDFVPGNSKTGESRMDLAKMAVNRVLGTLTFVDYVAVIRFSTEAEEVPVNGVYTLLQANRDNIQALIEEVNQIQPEGHTNFEQAFRLAFDMFERSTKVDRTSGCNKVILFLTDGSPTRGEDDPTKLGRFVESLNTGPNGQQIASIFSYSIGEITEGETRQDILYQIACNTNGLTAQVEATGAVSLQEQLSQYHEYYSTFHTGTSHTVWTEPYLDSFGAEQVITAAKAIYDKNSTSASSQFIGVVAVDISYDHIMQLESDYEEVLKILQQRQMSCPQFQVNKDCDLEVLRQKDYADGIVSYIEDTSKVCNTTSVCPLPGNQVCLDGPFKYENCQQHKNAGQNYKKEACCGEFELCPSSAAWGHMECCSNRNTYLLVVVLLHSIIFLLYR